MATASSESNTGEFGVIILGNVGAGKSYLCNLLIGSERFAAKFNATAVTKATAVHTISDRGKSVNIYDIPGLVESNQKHINRNKEEIEKAFVKSPMSVVIFVWRQHEGRLLADDIMAFNALRDAYKFPPGSLMFVVNNIPRKIVENNQVRKRPREFNGQFFKELEVQIKPMPVTMNDTIFIDALKPKEIERREQARFKLFELIGRHQAMLQKRHHEIVLDMDMLEQMREQIMKQQKDAEKNAQAYAENVRRLTGKVEEVKATADARIEQMQRQLNGNSQNPGFFTFLGMALDAAGRSITNFLPAQHVDTILNFPTTRGCFSPPNIDLPTTRGCFSPPNIDLPTTRGCFSPSNLGLSFK